MLFRDAKLTALTLACVAGLGFAVAATAQDAPILSSEPEALPPPEAWSCNRIGPEYDAWLRAGNTPESWRYVGPTYRKAGTDETYDWNTWLEWHRTKCGFGVAGGDPDGSAGQAGGTNPGLLVGGIVGSLGAAAIAAGTGGGNNDSPG